LGQEKNTHTRSEEGCDIEGEVSINIEFEGEEKARIVYKALIAELLNPPTYRSNVKITLNGRLIKIKIFSRDLVSLRAAVNSYMKWLSAILGAVEVLEDELGGHKKSASSAATGNNA